TSSGPRSPPIASTAMRIMGLLRGVEAERLDLAALVGAAGAADAMGPLGLPALRADVDAGRGDRVRRAPLVAPGLGGLPLRDGHDRRHYSRTLVTVCYLLGALALQGAACALTTAGRGARRAPPSGGRRRSRRGCA